MLHFIWYIIVGFIVGLVARAIMPGAQHLGFIMTTILGIAGSIVGGLIARLFSKPEPGSSFPGRPHSVNHWRDHSAFSVGKIRDLTKAFAFFELVGNERQTLPLYSTFAVSDRRYDQSPIIKSILLFSGSVS